LCRLDLRRVPVIARRRARNVNHCLVALGVVLSLRHRFQFLNQLADRHGILL
jgi:hypothetical protein